MGDNFSNPIVGGMSNLIREAIKSPNFLTGVQGWTINKDGSAEFQDATFRGTIIIGGSTNDAVLFYSPSPGAGNLYMSLAPSAGVDRYGNNYFSGFTFYQSSAVIRFEDTGINKAVQFLLDLVNHVFLVQNSPGLPITFDLFDTLQLRAPDTIISMANTLTTPGAKGLKVGSGLGGMYYDEEWSGFLTACATGALITVDPTIGSTHKIHNDYNPPTHATLWSGSSWAAPDDATYVFSSYFPNIYDGDWANVHRHLINGTIVDSLGVNNGVVHSPGIASLVTEIELAKNDVFTMAALQNSGASRSMTAASRIHIRRSL